MVLTTKVCPCCNSEDKLKKEYTKADYIGNGLLVDDQNRVMILCDACILIYGGWKSL
ncbi:hypothetical protein [Paenibacillus sp. MMO-177]|uniref:hypothetical protein n=1 Tax=Paenibacillus sp. MMO-177 TaxID=3081289 RepID=UPI003015AD3F